MAMTRCTLNSSEAASAPLARPGKIAGSGAASAASASTGGCMPSRL